MFLNRTKAAFCAVIDCDGVRGQREGPVSACSSRPLVVQGNAIWGLGAGVGCL